MILEGKTLAKQIRESLPARAARCAELLGRPLKLVGVGWAADYASYLYLKKEIEAAEKTGIKTEIVDISENTTPEHFLELLQKLSADVTVDAVLVPKPLPKPLSDLYFWEHLDPAKDIDGTSTMNMGRLFMCKNWAEITAMEGFVPCTALAVMRLMEFHKIDIAGKEVAVLGRSGTVGRPLAHMVVAKDATVTILHSRTLNLPEITKRADVVISAIGKARFLKKDMLKKGAKVIDVGTNQDENGVFCGDIDCDAITLAGHDASPVPGGVGPVTLACLLENIVISGERKIVKEGVK